MYFLKKNLDYGILLLALVGQGFIFVSMEPGSTWYFAIAVLFCSPLLIKFLLFLLEEKDREKKKSVDEKIISRSSGEIISKHRNLNEEGIRAKARVSSVFLHLKELASNRNEEEIIGLFIDLLSKHLGFQKISYFSFEPEGKVLKLRKSTDLALFKAGELEIAVDGNSLLGYAAAHKVGLEHSNLKQNLEIAHLDQNAPVSMKVCAPILYDSDFFGMVNVGGIPEEELKQEDRQFFAALCTLLGLSLKSSQSFFRIEKDLLNTRKQVEEKEALNERIKSIFGKFTSPNVVNALVENRREVDLGGEARSITVMFSDIRNFTTYCEKTAPEKVVKILNDYLTRMSQVIIKYDGTLDKYIGDEIMAFWGAPLDQPRHARLAVQAGYEMILEMKKLHLLWEKEGTDPFSIGVGMNTGEMIVGNVGSTIRMDYTVIGDSVNLAARVERLTRKFNSDFLITEYTYQQVKDIVKARKIGAVQVTGKEDPVMIYSVEWVDLKPMNN